MKIRKSSWHYRLYGYCTRELDIRREGPLTICSYLGVFLQVAFILLLFGAITGLILAMPIAILCVIGHMAWQQPWPTGAGILVAVIFGIWWNLDFDGKLDGLYDKIERRFGPFFAAVRRKVCPPIEIT